MGVRLSIIIPVFNTEKYLRRCLESVILQSYKDIEVIVVNDCSTDNSAQIINEYCNKDNRIVCAQHDKNRGLFQARITGVEHASGEYVAFVDSDDYISQDFYRELVECAIQKQYDIVAGNTTRDYGDGRLSQYTFHKICFSKKALNGSEVCDSFYEQEGSCYAWHTIWNKIYSKHLWNQCLLEFQRITEHLIMCEDVAFSCVLFYHARSFKYVNSSSNSYYYCVNQGAATDANKITYPAYCRKLHNVNMVFDFVDSFLKEHNAESHLIYHFKHFRMRYYEIWRGIAERNLFERKAEARKLLLELKPTIDKQLKNTEYQNFEIVESESNTELDNIRGIISRKETEIVSFDIFDTLIFRPLWNPTDLFELMQLKFEEICPSYKNLSFKSFRLLAEREAREEAGKNNKNVQDVCLSDIYHRLQEDLSLPEESIIKLQEIEECMEIMFSRQRVTAKALYDFAIESGKRVILVSDMYLSTKIIKQILLKNGYSGYEKLFLSSHEKVLKSSGSLFDKVIKELCVNPNCIVHIGDNVESDVIIPRKKHIHTIYFPKAKDRLQNRLEKYPTNRLSAIASYASGCLTSENKIYSSIGYRSMVALISGKLFDNPFASWNADTDFDVNPLIVGYYPIGMHLVGVARWLSDIAKRKSISHICFLSRDGYLPLKVFDLMKPYLGVESITTSYIPCSRLCLFPWIIETAQGLYSLPVSPLSHTPCSIFSILEKYCNPIDEEALKDLLRREGFSPDKRFKSQMEYYQFITWFKNHLFIDELLEKEKQVVSNYYTSHIPSNSLVFDMGYSGRIPYALQKAIQYPVHFAYVHHDNENFNTQVRRGNLNVDVMYNLVPPYSDLIREVFLSEVGNSCIGFKEEDGEIVPLFEEVTLTYGEQFVQQKIKEGCVEFINDFFESFEPVKDALSFDPVQVSLPFEGLIHLSNQRDRNVLYTISGSDQVYGAQDKISMTDFWISQANVGEFSYNIQDVLSGKSIISKCMSLWILDRKMLKHKVRKKLSGHPVFMNCLVKTYRIGKKFKRALKG